MRFSKVHLYHHPFSSERSMKNAIFFSIFSPSTYFTQDTLLYTHSTLNNLQFLTTFFSTIHSSFSLFCFFLPTSILRRQLSETWQHKNVAKEFLYWNGKIKTKFTMIWKWIKRGFCFFFSSSSAFRVEVEVQFFEKSSLVRAAQHDLWTHKIMSSVDWTIFFFVMWSVDSQSIIIKLNRPPLLLLIADFIKLLILLCKFWVCSPPETYFSTSSPLFFHSFSFTFSFNACQCHQIANIKSIERANAKNKSPWIWREMWMKNW